MTPKNSLHYREQRAAYWQQVTEKVVSPFKRRLKRATSFTMAVFIIATNLFLIQLFTSPMPVQAASAGPREATATGDCVNDTGTGTVAWTSPGNAFSNNATYASVSVDGTTSNYIKCTNFGFTIPAGTTINGIIVAVERKSNSTGNGGSQDAAVRVVKGGAIGGTDRSTATIYTTSDVSEDHGGATDLWGDTWSYTDINATNFGAAFATTKVSAAGAAHSVTVDVITITVHYTLNPVYDQSSYRWFNNQDATFGLVETWGGGGQDSARDSVMDSSNNIYVVGETNSVGLTGSNNDQTLVKYNSSGVEQWSKTWGGDGLSAAHGVALDSSGNIYVVGYTNSTGFTAGNQDQTLVKYNSSGVEQWSKTWGGTANDFAYDVALDSSGNIYVVGNTSSTGFTAGSTDQTLVKYNSSGVEQWSKTWGGTGSETARDLVLDSSGNIFVTGETSTSGFTAGGNDQTLVKYDSSGVEQWSKTWGGDGNDNGWAVSLDASGNIYVAGDTTSTGFTAGSNDQTLVKYNSSGVEQWSKTWGGTGIDTAYAMAIDTSNNIYVGGYTESTGFTAGSGDQTLVKYDSSGVEQWSKTWGDSSSEIVFSVNISSVGTIITTGTVSSSIFSVGSIDQSLLIFSSAGTIDNCSSCVDRAATETDRATSETDRAATEVNRDAPQILIHCGTTTGFISTWGGTGTDSANDVATDASGNIYVVGDTASSGLTAGSSDLTLVKYNSSGVEQWSKTLGDSAYQTGYAIVLDSSGNIYIGGESSTSGTSDVFISKFDSSGVEQWSKTWGGSGTEAARGIALDGSNNIYITGYINSTGFTAGLTDVFLMKFDSSGVEQWTKTWGGTADDAGYGVKLDGSGNVYVAGITASTGFTAGGNDIVLMKFNSSGVEQWTKTVGGTSGDEARDLAIDASGNLYVAGFSASTGFTSGSSDFTVIKFNSSGAEQWTKSWGGAAGVENGFSIELDSSGNIYVSGETSGSFGSGLSQDHALTKLNSSGVEQWSVFWGGTDNAERSNGLLVDTSGNAYVAGYTSSSSYTTGGNEQILAKFDKDAAYCHGACSLITTTEVDRTVTETDRAATEVDRTVTETDRALTETDRTMTEVYRNENTGAVTIDVGSALNGVAQNTSTTANPEGTAFRLRMTLHVSTGDAPVSSGLFKLQYAVKSGTCDTAFSGESYADVTSSTPIAYYNNTNATDGNSLTANANDPVHSGHSNIAQQYNETGNFDITSAIAAGSDGLWDFPLIDYSAPASTSYCFRVVTSSGSQLGAYTVVPEISTTTVLLNQSNYRWYENFDSSTTYAQSVGSTLADIARDVTVDASGNSFIVGESTSPSFGDSTNGQTLSKVNSSGLEKFSYGWGGGSTDIAHGVVTDSSGNIYVVGQTASTGFTAGGNDQTLVKYDSTGVEQWSKTWGGDASDIAYAVALDGSGNIYVVGSTASTGFTAGSDDQSLVKYNSSGVEQWSKTWGGTGSDIAYDLALDGSGNIYVVGSSASTGFTAGGNDQTLVMYNSSGVEQWTKTVGGTAADVAYSIVLDASTNIYVAGSSASTGFTAGSDDQTLIKYNSSGVEQWTKSWGGTGSDIANDVAIDTSGNLYVVGQTASTGFTAGGNDQTLVKYNSSGVEQWSKTWGGTGSEIAYSVARESTGTIIVVGSADTASFVSGSTDQTILKFDSTGSISSCASCVDRATSETDRTVTETNRTATESDRTVTESDRTTSEVRKAPQILVNCGSVDGFTNGWGGDSTEVARSVAIDTSGNIYTAGDTSSTGLTAGSQDVTLVKFNSSGVEQWSKTWGSTGTDIANDLELDSSGNIYVVGYTTSYTAGGNDQFLIKFNSSGIEQWSKTWGGTGDDRAYSLKLDSTGNIIVGGLTDSTGFTNGSWDATLVKYNSSGVEQWSKTWGGTNLDVFYDLVLDGSDNIFATGLSSSTNYSFYSMDMILVRFNSSGVEQWSKAVGGVSSERGLGIALDQTGAIYVAGSSDSTGWSSGASDDMLLVKFNSSGNTQWIKTLGGSSGTEYSTGISIDGSNNIYVSGYSNTTGYTYNGTTDHLVSKFNSNGNEEWTTTWGADSAEQAYALKVYNSSQIYVAGDANGVLGTYQSLSSLNTNATNCHGICRIINVTEVNKAYTETDMSLATEVDRTTSEVDRTVTETDRSVTEVNINEVVAGSSIGIGSPLNNVPQNASAFIISADQPFRLRMLLYDYSKTASSGGLGLKLQFAPKIGTCDTGFIGESYTDVTTSSTIAYYNTAYTDGSIITALVNDPTAGGTIVPQTLVEANNFTNSNATSVGNYYMWDFALTTTGQGGTSYCMRVVNSSGSTLYTYEQIPEISVPPTTDQVMRHGKFFNPVSGERQAFYW